MLFRTTTLSILALTAFISACSSDPAAPVAGSGGSNVGSGGSGGVTTAGSGGATPAGSGGATAGSGGAIADGGPDSAGSQDTAGTGGADGGMATMTFAEACAFAAKVRCERFDACVHPYFQAFYADQVRCQADETAQCMRHRGLPSSKTAPGDVVACAKALQAATCDDWQAFDEYDEYRPEACKTIPGTAPNGAACAVYNQCMSGYCALGAGSTSCGVCKARVAIGGACPEDDACVDGAFCKSGKCASKSASGVICEDNVECQDGLMCFRTGCGKGAAVGAACQDSFECGFNIVCRGGKCVHVGKAGEACSINPADGEDSCGEGYSCGPGNKCVALTIVKAGQPCNQSENIICDRDSACSGDMGGAGTCLALVPIGGTCDPNRDFCAVPADCIGGKCTVVDLSMCK